MINIFTHISLQVIKTDKTTNFHSTTAHRGKHRYSILVTIPLRPHEVEAFTAGRIYQNRVVKCDVTKIKICKPMGFVEIIREIKAKNVSLPRISMLMQIVGDILPQLCSNDSIQILLKMAWFITL